MFPIDRGFVALGTHNYASHTGTPAKGTHNYEVGFGGAGWVPSHDSASIAPLREKNRSSELDLPSHLRGPTSIREAAWLS